MPVTRPKNTAREPLSRAFFSFFAMHTSFITFWALPNIFINTFLVSLNGDVRISYVFNIIICAVQGFAELLASRLYAKTGAKAVTRIGLGLYAFAYLQLLVFRENSVTVMPLIAVASGTAGGFYWLGYALAVKNTTSDANRDAGLGLIGSTTAGVMMAAPLASGAIIKALAGGRGYFAVFFLSFLFALTTFFFAGTVRFGPFSPRASGTAAGAVRAAAQSPAMRFGLAAEFCRGLYDGAFGIILSLLIFLLTRDEFTVGLAGFIAGAAGMAFNLTAAGLLKPSRRAKSIAGASLLLSAVAAGLFFSSGTAALFAAGTVNALAWCLTSIPNNSMFVKAVETLTPDGRYAPAFFSFREISLNFGRIAGFLLLLFMPQNTNACVAVMLALALSQLLTAAFNAAAARATAETGGEAHRALCQG
ncbi:MAG TPA: hypothetical protein PL044_06150 [Clostridiales bacterium]|nr:MAG: hypothetical protein BWY37_01006 [Firmicutes bacterium ADurb.Bin262]HOU10949.1 hypothetical protein [Clostridiales bacterium]HQH62399.1 hypothetical protein [Clostridiales bacterium]HQK73338.1 hypothetical protein [Clostridiales bacterium]